MASVSVIDANSQLNGLTLSFSENLEGNVMLENLRQQRELGKFCDITLVVGGKHFPAHRSVLAASSPYFDSILKNHPIAQEKIDISWHDVDTFHLMLDYMYSGNVVINDKNVNELLKLSNHFAIPKLKGYCEQYLEKAKKSTPTNPTLSPSSQLTRQSQQQQQPQSSLSNIRAILEKQLAFPNSSTATSSSKLNPSDSSDSPNFTNVAKGPAPSAPNNTAKLTQRGNVPPLPSKPPQAVVTRSQSERKGPNKLPESGNRPKPAPPSSRPPPPPKSNNHINGLKQKTNQNQNLLSPSRQGDINRRQSFGNVDYGRQHSRSETNSFDGISPPPPPPLPPPSSFSGQSWNTLSKPPQRNNSISSDIPSHTRSSFLHSTSSSNSTLLPSRSISKSSNFISSTRPSQCPPPPPSRNTSTGANNNHTNGGIRNHQGSGNRGTAPLPPPPPPSQTYNLQVKVMTNSRGSSDVQNRQGSFNNSIKAQAPAPPMRNTSISKNDLESRFRHVFRDINQLPEPESYTGSRKHYPSRDGTSRRRATRPTPQEI